MLSRLGKIGEIWPQIGKFEANFFQSKIQMPQIFM